MFFTISKVLWFIVNPGNLLLLALLAAGVLSFTRWQRAAIWTLRCCLVAIVVLATVPFGKTMRHHLENRFPQAPALPSEVAGIVILGGIVAPALSADRGSAQFGSAVERLLEGAALAKRYPAAKVIFSGGSGSLFETEFREAHYVAPIFAALGLAEGRVVYEDRARNTRENAVYTKEIAQPRDGETWVLVTSASHMPRSMGVFRKLGWRMIPYPVDYATRKSYSPTLMFNLISGIEGLGQGLYEFIGLTAYWINGYTDSWYPGPSH